jgi:hypothetical protein
MIRRLGAVAAAATLVAVLVGCGSDEPSKSSEHPTKSEEHPKKSEEKPKSAEHPEHPK